MLVSCSWLMGGVDAGYIPPDPSIHWFNQTLDHFNSSDTRTFHQRYLVYSDYYMNSTRANKPIFFCPGGEANAMGGYQHNGFMFEYGITLGAFLLFPEHRYYGESIPFGPVKAYEQQNIRYLTIEQALQDYYTIIKAVMAQWNIPSTTPIIAFGGSYPGELAAFMRLSFPNVRTIASDLCDESLDQAPHHDMHALPCL